MKKIKINALREGDKSSVFTKQRRHQVVLGNGQTVYFKDLKRAKAYITATNEFLNQKLYEINALYIDVFTEYRKAWFYFFDIYDRRMHIVSDNNVLQEIHLIENKMTIMVARAHFTNGPFIVWNGFRLMLESMENICNTLIYLYKQKKHYSEAHQVRAILSRINIMYKELERYGAKSPPVHAAGSAHHHTG
jgi:hypothetical protein